MQDRQTAHLTITVASLTRRRPGMVQSLIRSWGEMQVPENTTVRCLIVENDEVAQVQDLVATFDPLPNGLPLDYVLETQPGIPFGRNRAAKEAIANGADLLAFADDDEVVASDWLVQMVKGYREGTARLLGAPLRLAPAAQDLTLLERVMHDNLTEHFRRREHKIAAKTTYSTTPSVSVFTGNWMGETRLFSQEGIWFDEEMRFTGGTDSKFCGEVKGRGIPVGWVKDAFVYETVSRDRLGFGYQFGRARDQINVHSHRKMAERPLSRYGLVLRLPGKIIEIIILAIAVPLTRGKTLLKLAKTMGWVAGRVGAAFGVRSTLYRNITGG